MVDLQGRKFLMDLIPKYSVGAEIGVWNGSFSEAVLHYINPIELYLIDPWMWELPEPVDKINYIANTRIAKSQLDMDKLFHSVMNKFINKPNVHIIRNFSVDVRPAFNDEYFDFIYIDGAHDYENVKADLASWHSAVKNGGLLILDDYDWGPQFDCPVKQAITQFVYNNHNFKCEVVKNNQCVLRKNNVMV